MKKAINKIILSSMFIILLVGLTACGSNEEVSYTTLTDDLIIQCNNTKYAPTSSMINEYEMNDVKIDYVLLTNTKGICEVNLKINDSKDIEHTSEVYQYTNTKCINVVTNYTSFKEMLTGTIYNLDHIDAIKEVLTYNGLDYMTMETQEDIDNLIDIILKATLMETTFLSKNEIDNVEDIYIVIDEGKLQDNKVYNIGYYDLKSFGIPPSTYVIDKTVFDDTYDDKIMEHCTIKNI